MTNAGRHPGTSPRPAGSGGELHSSLTATPHPSEEGIANDRPAIGGPGEGANLEGRDSVVQGIVGVIDEIVVAAVRQDRVVPRAVIAGVASEHERTPAAGHRAAVATDVGAGDGPRPAEHDLVGAVRPTPLNMQSSYHLNR